MKRTHCAALAAHVVVAREFVHDVGELAAGLQLRDHFGGEFVPTAHADALFALKKNGLKSGKSGKKQGKKGKIAVKEVKKR